MGGFLRGLFLGALLIGAGWVGGSILPAPDAVTRPIAERVPNVAARLGLDEVTLSNLSRLLTDEELVRLRHEASQLAARAGEAIVVERDPENLAAQIAALPTAPTAISAPVTDAVAGAAVTPATVSAFETSLSLCPGMAVSNAPAADGARQVRNYARLINVEGVALAANPTRGACLSSAVGPRGSGRHDGTDYYARDGGPILAAANGAVIEAKYRDDYGNMLLIDHGGGVYTRYAHLSSFSEGIVQGARVQAGQQLGLMGNTASYAIPIHLHYEVLTGDYNNPRASFGLAPRSPFTFPSAP